MLLVFENNRMENQTVTLQLDVFEGPLDLLLHLIKKNDLAISRVSLSQVTDQYLLYLSAYEELDIDMASEFLLIAAELAHIKSKSLLPSGKDDEAATEDEGEGVDLIARLREYQKYKQAAGFLSDRPWLGRDVYKRGEVIFEAEESDEPKAESYEVTAYDLIAAFATLLKKLPKEAAHDHRVMVERVSVTERIYEMLDRLKTVDNALFSDFFSEASAKVDYVVTFLAILEMARLKMIMIFQTGNFEPIRLQRRMEIADVDGVVSQAKDDFR